MVPAPPESLTGAPREFYDGVRAALDAGSFAVDWEAAEVDFGDAGVAVSLPHAQEPGLLLTAQCSRVAAIVFAGPTTTHFDRREAGWVDAAVALFAAVLAGEAELDAGTRRRPQPVRIDFRA